MALLSVLNLAQQSLGAHGAGLGVTGQNIAGANLPGYVRKTALYEDNAVRSGLLGGVTLSGTQRHFDVYAFKSVLTETSLKGHADMRERALQNVEAVLTPDGDETIGDRLAALFSAFNGLASEPGSQTTRNEVIARARHLAQGFNQVSAGITRERNEAFAQARDLTGDINEKLADIAALNGKIAGLPESDSLGRAGLMDERDELVRAVAEHLDVNSLQQADGTVTLLAAGTALVEGLQASQLDATLTQTGELSYSVTRGALVTDVTTRIGQGSLGALKEARDGDMVALLNDLDALAGELSEALNNQHAAGQDLSGNPGLALFVDQNGNPLTPGPGAAAAMTFNDNVAADQLAAGSAAAPPPGGNDNAIALMQLGDQALGSGTPIERFADVTAQVGRELSAAKSASQLRDGTLAAAESRRASVSGVSMDEEMVELAKLERAFEASMRVLQAADQMIQELMQLR